MRQDWAGLAVSGHEYPVVLPCAAWPACVWVAGARRVTEFMSQQRRTISEALATTGPRVDLYTPEQAAQDRVLVERVRSGRRGGASVEEADDARLAMGDLVQRYQDRVYAICLRMLGGAGAGRQANRDTASDLAHDALLKVIQSLESYDGRSRLSTWIIRVAMNVCLSHLRSAKVRRHVSLDASPEGRISGALLRDGNVRSASGREVTSGREPEPPESVEHEDERRRVLAALSVLDPEQRAVLVLRDMQGLDYDQIAAALDIAVGTVKSRLFRARLALRDAFPDSGEEKHRS